MTQYLDLLETWIGLLAPGFGWAVESIWEVQPANGNFLCLSASQLHN